MAITDRPGEHARAPVPSPARRPSANRALNLLGWLVVVPLLVLAATRFLAWDSRAVLVGLNALTPIVPLPAWIVVVAAVALRRWPLLAAAVVVIVAQLSFAVPELRAATDVPPAARRAPSLRLFTANVFAGNTDAGPYADEIRRSRPDVVVLQESSPSFLAALEQTGVLRDLPHRLVVSRTDPFAAFVASRWALSEDDVVGADGRPVLLRATVDHDGRRFRLFAFHAIAPFGGNLAAWEDDLLLLKRAVDSERGPVLIAGDFNATWGNRQFRALLGSGLTDAAAARGQPFQMTWSRSQRLVPPLLRIDHVLTSEHLVVTSIATGEGRGSDHRPIVAEVALL